MWDFRRVDTERHLREEVDAAKDTQPVSAGDETQPANYMKRLAGYIPGEVTALYLTLGKTLEEGMGSAAGSPEGVSLTGYWILFGACAVLAVGYTLYTTTKRVSGKWQFQRFQILMAPIAFVIWAYALGGPFAISCAEHYSPIIAGLAVGISAVTIPLLDMILDKFFRKPAAES